MRVIKHCVGFIQTRPTSLKQAHFNNIHFFILLLIHTTQHHINDCGLKLGVSVSYIVLLLSCHFENVIVMHKSYSYRNLLVQTTV